MKMIIALLIALNPLMVFATTSTAPVDIGSTGTVGISGSLPAGTALMGKVGFDQTTPGTTNAVSLGYIGTTATATGNGTVSAGVQRVSIASDNTAFSVNANLKDSAGTSVTVGQKVMGSSLPVALASDQGPITASLTSSALTIGGVTQVGTWTVQSGASFSTRSDTFTTTSNGTTVDAHLAPVKSFSLAVKATGSVTSWTVVLECSLDNTNFTTVLTHTNVSPADGQIMAAGTSLFPCMYYRTRASAITLGAGTNVIATLLGT